MSVIARPVCDDKENAGYEAVSADKNHNRPCDNHNVDHDSTAQQRDCEIHFNCQLGTALAIRIE